MHLGVGSDDEVGDYVLPGLDAGAAPMAALLATGDCLRGAALATGQGHDSPRT